MSPPSTTALTALSTAPSLSSYVPLEIHEAATPAVFHGGKPVLHYLARGVSAAVPGAGAAEVAETDTAAADAAGADAHGDDAPGWRRLMVFGEEGAGRGGALAREVLVDVYITSENLILFNTAINKGISIPYPCIALHAIQSFPDPRAASSDTSPQVKGLYLQLELQDESSGGPYDDEDLDIIDLTLIPSSADTEAPHLNGTASSSSSSSNPSQTPAYQLLYQALTTCSNLNPTPGGLGQLDNDDDDAWADDRIVFEGSIDYDGVAPTGIDGLPGVLHGREDGGLPPPFPGSGGWITADNVDQYFDEEGNWRGGNAQEGGVVDVDGGDGIASLGDGAGRVRGRSEFDEDALGQQTATERDGEANGETNGTAGADRVEDESGKWQRTG